jgi:hypothetical protein
MTHGTAFASTPSDLIKVENVCLKVYQPIFGDVGPFRRRLDE